MGYRLVQLDIADLPERLSLSESEGGLGLVFRDRGRVVGFHLVDGEQMGPERSCVPAALIGGETRIALEAERLRDAYSHDVPAESPTITVAICSKDRWEWVDRLLADVDAIVASEDMQSLPTSLEATLAQLRDTLDSVSADSAMQERLMRTVTELDRTLQSLRTLLDTLKEKPNALIFSSEPGEDPQPPAGSP